LTPQRCAHKWQFSSAFVASAIRSPATADRRDMRDERFPLQAVLNGANLRTPFDLNPPRPSGVAKRLCRDKAGTLPMEGLLSTTLLWNNSPPERDQGN